MSRDRIAPSLTVAELGQVITQGLMLYRARWQTYAKVISSLLPMLCVTAAAIALLPLWQLVKSALYDKILCRQEGVDLQLPTRP